MYEEGESELVDAARIVARALNLLGNADAGTPMGGLEALGKVHMEAGESIAGALGHIADAIEALVEAIAGSGATRNLEG